MVVCSVLLLFAQVSADWIELQSPLIQPKRPKGEEEKPTSQIEGPNEDCAPDIHAWTSQTWGTQSNISQKAESRTGDSGVPQSTEGKMLLLRAAHDRLMNQIESRVLALGGREGRGDKGGMGSMEGALITISLLTFAVYLIKLVMMLIHALHAKKAHHATDMLDSTDIPAGVQTFVIRPGRRRRSLVKEQQYQLYAAMENVNFT